jgi:hypothetical protein
MFPVTSPPSAGGKSPPHSLMDLAAAFADCGRVTGKPELTPGTAAMNSLTGIVWSRTILLHTRSVRGLRSRRCVGPFADPDEENSHPFFRVIRRHKWRARQIGSPAFRRVARNKKHQMRMPTHIAVA